MPSFHLPGMNDSVIFICKLIPELSVWLRGFARSVSPPLSIRANIEFRAVISGESECVKPVR